MAAKGGKREGAGRKPKPRLMDHSTAERVLAKIKAEERWEQLFNKAMASRSTTEAVAILRYLEDRVYGKPVAPVEHKGDKENPVELNVGIANGTTERLLALLGGANKRRLEVSQS